MRPVGDSSRIFTAGLALSWLVLVALPLWLSLSRGDPLHGLPLIGVVVWIGLLRAARTLSPAAHADALLRRGRYDEALAICGRALSVAGLGEWTGTRRLVWLNRRASALLALGRGDEALTSALEAMEISADPETLGNCALSLLWLNRYDEAAGAARLALSLTRERSLTSNAVLSAVHLAHGRPAEAEALAQAGRTDGRALLPISHPERYALCLAALCRALRLQGKNVAVEHYLDELRQATRGLAQSRGMALVEEAEELAAAHGSQADAFRLLADAYDASPDYVEWYVAQPDTFRALRLDPQFAQVREAASARFMGLAEKAPDVEIVALALASARQYAHARPAIQSSRPALTMQVLTLSATLLLLLWWTWRFFLLTP